MKFCPLIVSTLLLLAGVTARGGYADDVGYVQLFTEFGGVLASGSSVSVSQVEASNGNDYTPDISNADFFMKGFYPKSGPLTAISGHATTVAQYFYGRSFSMAPGVAYIDTYDADGWAEGDFLQYGIDAPPLVEMRDVENHSWIGSAGPPANSELVRRLDYAISRDDFIAVVGLNNGSGTAIPPLLAETYNGISVGVSNGQHSSGMSANDGPGRVKPEIVSPLSATSYSTPTVGAAAALLLDRANQTPAWLPDAHRSVAIKAMLLAGATKPEFADWNRTTSRPLDAHFGAGQLNIYNSYHILTAGPQRSGTTSLVAATGWDFATTTTGSRLYFFDIPAGTKFSTFSALTTWNRVITTGTGGWTDLRSALPNLSLRLYSASGFTIGSQLDQSTSSVDNVESILRTEMMPGRYAIEVTADQPGVEYGLAWTGDPRPFSTVTISAGATSPAEIGPVAGAFVVNRTTSANLSAVQVKYAVSGTAINGTDYSSLPLVVMIPTGQTSVTVPVTPIPDSLIEGNETLTITLIDGQFYDLGSSASATLTIKDKPFDEWRKGKFSAAVLNDPSIVGEAADPDGDGLPNLVEYAQNLLPTVPDAGGAQSVGIVNGHLTLSYLRSKNAPDISCTPQLWTQPANGWQSGAALIEEVPPRVDHGSSETVTVRAIAPVSADTKQFLRLLIQRP